MLVCCLKSIFSSQDRLTQPDDWGRPDGWTPRGSYFAILAHLSQVGGDCTTTLKQQDIGATPSPPV